MRTPPFPPPGTAARIAAMNEVVKAPARRRWSLDELDRLAAHGFFGEHEHVELIGGELYQMAPKGIRHERVRGLVSKTITRRLSASADLYQELGWRPDGVTYLEPDLMVCRATSLPPEIRPHDVLLVIEIAMSSLDHDQGLKAETYAGLGIADYWVIDAVSLSTRLHRKPSQRRYEEISNHPATETLVPLDVAGLTLRLADFEFGTDGLDERDP
jgi:Uma2 family endonuclease